MASLLDTGNTLKDTIDLLNLDTYEIFTHLQQGHTFEDYVLENGKGVFVEHFSFFIGICSLSDAIRNSIDMMQMENEFIKKLKKESAYPIFIFMFSFIAIYIFTTFIIPMLLNSFSDIDTNSIFITLLDNIKIASMLTFICVFMLILGYIGFKNNTHIHFYVYRYIVPYIPFLKQYISYSLSGYLRQLNACGMSTKEAFLYLIHFNHKTLTTRFVKDCYDRLVLGEELTSILKDNTHLDKMFIQYILTGIYSSKLDSTLVSYMETRWILWVKSIKRFIVCIQIMAYVFVGILLICVYQIMLLPMEMIQNL